MPVENIILEMPEPVSCSEVKIYDIQNKIDNYYSFNLTHRAKNEIIWFH